MKVFSVPIEAFDEWIDMPGEEIDRRAGAAPDEQVLVNFLSKEEQAMHTRALIANQPLQATHNSHYKQRRSRQQDASQILTVEEAAARLSTDRNEV